MLSRFLDRILTGMGVLAGLLLLFITFSISYSIVTRSLGFQSPVWTVQFNEYSLLWITFLGSAWVLRRQKHVAVDIITGRLGPAGRRIANVLHSILGVGLCAVLCWYTSRMTLNLFQRGVTDVQAVDTPKYLVLIIIPVGFFFLTAQFFRNLRTSLRRAESDPKRLDTQKSSSESPAGGPGAIAERRKD
ncbi:MAG: TRAP transporter small permease [Deltaproteobacteria bacterium]|nr:TRAP transporter small permease [Deltaproteobacteria bacterium]